MARTRRNTACTAMCAAAAAAVSGVHAFVLPAAGGAGMGAVSAQRAATVARAPHVSMVAAAAPQTKVNGAEDDKAIILSTVERARTVTHIASSGSLCTYSLTDDPELQGAPFGSHVDYVLDTQGWPIFLLAEASLHTKNIKANNKVSLLCQTPPAESSQPAAAMSRVTLVGYMETLEDEDELIQLKATFPLTHAYAAQLVDSPRFVFYKLRPEKIYYVGGYGVLSKWLDVQEYELAKPDILADNAARIAAKINKAKQGDLALVCKQFLNKPRVDNVVLTTVDRLGLDIRVTDGALTDEYRIGFTQVVLTTVDRLGHDIRVTDGALTNEYRIGFTQTVSSVEDAKSEIVKVFQEAWEKEQGFEWEDQGPPVQRYAEDILRKRE